jgi:hypothetical protein
LVYISNKTNESVESFKDYVKLKQKKQKILFLELSHLLLNERQNKLLSYFLENRSSYTNSSIHKNYY